MQDQFVGFVVIFGGVCVLFLTTFLILSISILIQALTWRWIVSSTNSEKTYRTHQRTLGFLFDGISLAPALIASYFWGAYLVAPLFMIMTGYTPPYTAIGTTVVMCGLLVLVIWKSRQVRHDALEGNVFSESRTAN